MILIKKILYSTDFPSYSNQAYFHAVALAEHHRASLTVVFVHTPDFTAPGPADPAAGKRYWQDQLEQIRPLNSDIPVSHVFLAGDPATEIVRFARDAGIDVIVMGTHGRTGLDRLLMGSVAEKVMRDAQCTVMVVKLPRGIPSARADVEVSAADK